MQGVRDRPTGGGDQGLTVGGTPNNVPTDNNAVAFARTVDGVLKIVYLKQTAGWILPQRSQRRLPLTPALSRKPQVA